MLDPAGHPAPFRSVTVARAGARYPSLYGATGADGTFEIAGLAPGSYRVCSDESFSTIDDAPGSAPGCRAGVAVVSGRTVTTTLHLHPGAALSGTITDPSGTPIEGVNVTVDSRHSYGGFAVTDAHGHYLVTGLAPTAYRVCFYTGSAVDPTHPGGVLPGCYHHKADVRVVSGSVRTGIDAALGLAGGIAGVVTDSRGDPVPGAEIDAFSTTRHGFGYGGTGRDGRYTLHGLAAGDYYLCVDVYTLGGSGQVSCRHKPVHVVSRRVTRGIGFTFTAGGSVTVTVRDDDRHPMVGVNEVLLRACTRHDYCDRQPVFDPKQPVVTAGSWISDATGSVTFRNVLPGTYAVCALTYHAATATDTSPTGYADTCSGHTFTVQVRARHTTRFAQKLHPGGVLTATVTDARGRPLRGAVVHVTGSPADVTLGYLGDPGSPIVQNTSAADGTVTIRGIRPGRARICVDASGAVGGTSLGGYRNRCLADLATVSAADTTALGPLALVAGGAITGRLLDTAGNPVRDSLAVVFSRHGHVVGDGRPNRAGEYRIDRLAAKTYVVCFLAYHYRSQCYDQVPWTGGAPPGDSGTPVVVTKGAVTSGIDAMFVHR